MTLGVPYFETMSRANSPRCRTSAWCGWTPNREKDLCRGLRGGPRASLLISGLRLLRVSWIPAVVVINWIQSSKCRDIAGESNGKTAADH